jgi:hypothetical protein
MPFRFLFEEGKAAEPGIKGVWMGVRLPSVVQNTPGPLPGHGGAAPRLPERLRQIVPARATRRRR